MRFKKIIVRLNVISAKRGDSELQLVFVPPRLIVNLQKADGVSLRVDVFNALAHIYLPMQ